MNPQRITVLGLGQLGLPVAAALAAAGHVVQGFDPDVARLALAREHGVHNDARHPASSHDEPPGSSHHAAPWLVTVLPDDATLAAAVHGNASAQGSGFRLPAGGVHICMGTLGLAQAQATAAAHQAQGQHFIAAPVFGRPDEAWARDLTALFGASPDVPEELRVQARALLACVAPRIHEAASPAAACAVKLAGNLLIASAIASMTEAFGLAQRHGADAALVQEVITGKLFKGPVYEGVGRAVARACSDTSPRSAAPGFTVRLGLKDLALCQAAARTAGHALPLASAAQSQLQRAADQGHGERDWSELPALLHGHVPCAEPVATTT